MAQEMDSSSMQILLKYRKNLFLNDKLLYRKPILKSHPEPVAQFVLPKRFICKVILACHYDNGHLGMERTLGLLQERFFWPKMAEDVRTHICTCERAEMQPILVILSNGTDSLRFPYIGRKGRRH